MPKTLRRSDEEIRSENGDWHEQEGDTDREQDERDQAGYSYISVHGIHDGLTTDSF